MINMSYVQTQIEMKKRKEFLQKHPYKIWKGEDGKWRTYLPSDGKKRVLKKRNTKNDIEDVVIDYYKSLDSGVRYDFGFYWGIWKERQIAYGVSSNTALKYDSDYIRYFQGTNFEKMDIRKITEEDITIFMVSKIKELKLKEKSGKSLWGYINGVFKSVRTRKVISDNPCQYVETKMFSRFYDRSEQDVAHRVISDNEMQLLMERLEKDHEKKPLYIQPYAVELAINTGMRVGELAALKWSKINTTDGIIIIDASEKYDRKNKEYIIAETKTGKSRYFPMTESLQQFFFELKKLQIKNNILGEFVFSNSKGRVTARSISECMRRKCTQVGIDERGIHALRRTLNSKMRCSGVPAPIAASLLGHTEKVNNNNYTYDITNMEYKKSIIESVIRA